jgi:hypothetical protein
MWLGISASIFETATGAMPEIEVAGINRRRTKRARTKGRHTARIFAANAFLSVRKCTPREKERERVDERKCINLSVNAHEQPGEFLRCGKSAGETIKYSTRDGIDVCAGEFIHRPSRAGTLFTTGEIFAGKQLHASRFFTANIDQFFCGWNTNFFCILCLLRIFSFGCCWDVFNEKSGKFT